MNPLKDLVGMKFGLLTVLNREGYEGRRVAWRCMCECGRKVVISGHKIKTGNTRSCGCLRARGNNRTHGLYPEFGREYSSWRSMMRRCYLDGYRGFPRYGGKGITVCERWHKFENFVADMGKRPPNTSIDRINSRGNYEPGNCRWATVAEQFRNRCNARLYDFHGERLTLNEIARSQGVYPNTLRYRVLKMGLSLNEALQYEHKRRVMESAKQRSTENV